MRLGRYDTSKIKVRSSGSGRMPGGRAGGIGCGTIILAAIGYFVFGLDPMQTIGTVQSIEQSAPATTQQGTLSEEQVCSRGSGVVR